MTATPIPPSPSRPATILIQTTIAATPNDWNVGRFHHLSELLANERDAAGQPRFHVLARDREPGDGPDSVLSIIDTLDIDVLFLFAVDTGNGLLPAECAAIERFRQRGGGVLLARDHMDLGSSLCGLADIGDAHHFHSKNPEADASRHVNDDVETAAIGWPNYHSGRNGDFQTITVSGPAIHPVLANPANPGGAIAFFPSHPHEGAISAPPARQARVIATGRSLVTGNAFNLIVAFESEAGRGRALAHSSFHHFADYNWDCSAGCPDFVSEAPGEAMANTPQARADIERYVVNAAGWLAGGQ
ncbi:MAG: hypothetical protein ACJ8HI_04060 [Massilia sp.]